MNLPEQRARAAELRGWVLWTDSDGINWWCEKPRRRQITVKKYTPDTNIQFADDLWHKLDEMGLRLLFFDNGKYIQIQDGETVAKSSFCVDGKGKWWSAALLEAVSKIPQDGE